MATITLLSPLLVMILAIPILISIYVYRDASRRGMHAVLWTLIALFTPSLIGFMVYLMVRNSYPDLICPKCNATVKESYIICPTCGNQLRASCTGCGAPVEDSWRVCPYCAQPLPENHSDMAPPVKRKDRSLGKLLALVIAVPVLLLVWGLFSFCFSGPGHSTSGFTSYQVDEYLKATGNEQTTQWLEQVGGDFDKAYILRYISFDNNLYTRRYAIYVPCAGQDSTVSLGVSPSLFGRYLKLKVDTHGQSGNTIFCVTSYSEEKLDLNIYCDEKKLNMEIMDVDFDPIPTKY